MKFGEYVRNKGYTAKSLAEQSSVSIRNIENYTTGRRSVKNMTLEIASKISRVLGLHAEDLLKFDENFSEKP